jgi:hypothetical protein
VNIKYKHLWAWDRMMGSTIGWSEMKQVEAEEDDAPLDAVYKGHEGKWHRFEDIESDETRGRIVELLKEVP